MENTKCKSVRVVGICGKEIINGGVNGEGYCEDCWTPDIAERHDLYRNYREEGSSREEAIELAGLTPPDVKIEDFSVRVKSGKKKKPFQDAFSAILDDISKEVRNNFKGFAKDNGQ